MRIFLIQRNVFLKILFIGTGLVGSHCYASFDSDCGPNWSVDLQSYNRCSNLPILSPANDNQTNMQLFLADKSLAKITAPKLPPMTWYQDYGSVPFEAATFKYSLSNITPSSRSKTLELTDDYIADERCQTNLSGTQLFIQQVSNDAALTASDKKLLIQKRKEIVPSCDKALAFIKVSPEWSALTRQYISYINASIAFYNGDYPTAQKIYNTLNTVKSPWISDTSAYMLVRTAVNQAYSSGLDEYGFQSLDKINKSSLAAAFNAITYYFKNHPQGQYAASTRGLLRRAYWMGGQQRQLIDEFLWQFNNASTPQFNLEMPSVAEEIDQRVFESKFRDVANFKDPFFLATYDLMHMRVNSEKKYRPISWDALQAQKEYFKSEPELFRYLQALHLLIQQNKPQQALDYLPKGNPPASLSYLQLSQFIVKSHILQKINADEAQSLLEVLLGSAKKSYQRPMVELLLALNLQHRQDFSAFFEPNGLITSPAIRAVVIKRAANAELLNTIIKSPTTSAFEKQIASFTLLHKSLNHEQYDQFIDALQYLPKDAAKFKAYESSNEDYAAQPQFNLFNWAGHKINEKLNCPSLVNITKTLASNSNDEMALLCLGEFVRLTNFKGSEYALEPNDFETNPAKTNINKNQFDMTLAQSSSAFPTPVFSRGEAYKKIIANSGDSELKAYALFRAINCYAPGGLNDCAGVEVNKEVRKGWFNQLKQSYPNSQWAKSLTYYW